MSHGHDHTPPSLPTPLSDADTLHRLGPGEARAAVGDWLALYTACFSTPPWSEPVRSLTEYQQQVGWHFDQPGFRALKLRGGDGRVVAVAYGWPAADTPPDRPYYRALAETLGDERMRRLWDIRPFEVVELMVDPGARGQGLARQLLTHLCPTDGVSWLATHPHAPAAAAYRRIGWQRIGGRTAGGGVPLDYFVLDPHQRLPSTSIRDWSGREPDITLPDLVERISTGPPYNRHGFVVVDTVRQTHRGRERLFLVRRPAPGGGW